MFSTRRCSFYVVRFLLLGAAEAGFRPALLYLTQWYPDARRARSSRCSWSAAAVEHDRQPDLRSCARSTARTGLGGWQWLFLLEALPSGCSASRVLRWLPNNIESAQWLNADEKHALRANLDADPSGNKSHALGKAFSDPKVWALGLIDPSVLLGLYAVSFWLPTILRDTGVKDAYHIGWMVIPNAAAVLATLYCGASSDCARERRWHIVVPFMVSAVALAIAASSSHGTFGTVLLFSLINAGAAAAMPVVRAPAVDVPEGSAAAGGIAFACSIANLGGFGSTYFIGWLRDTFHSQRGCTVSPRMVGWRFAPRLSGPAREPLTQRVARDAVIYNRQRAPSAVRPTPLPPRTPPRRHARVRAARRRFCPLPDAVRRTGTSLASCTRPPLRRTASSTGAAPRATLRAAIRIASRFPEREDNMKSIRTIVALVLGRLRARSVRRRRRRRDRTRHLESRRRASSTRCRPARTSTTT